MNLSLSKSNKFENFFKNDFFNFILILFSSIYIIGNIIYLIIGNFNISFFENIYLEFFLNVLFFILFYFEFKNKFSLISKITSKIFKYFFIFFIFFILIYIFFNYMMKTFNFSLILHNILDYTLFVLIFIYIIKTILKKSFEKYIFHRFEIIQEDMDEIKNGNISKRLTIFGVDEIDRMFYFTNDLLDELEKRINFEKKHSLIDPLTLCFNRRGLNLNFNTVKNKILREKGEISIVILDLDNFKKINDKYGHDIGDNVLVEFSKLIKSVLRDYDSLYRLGGEEFLILFPDTNKKNSKIILRRIQKKMDKYFLQKVEGLENKITFSGGYASSKDFNLENDNVLDEMFKKSDKLLYKVKRSGKDDISFE